LEYLIEYVILAKQTILPPSPLGEGWEGGSRSQMRRLGRGYPQSNEKVGKGVAAVK